MKTLGRIRINIILIIIGILLISYGSYCLGEEKILGSYIVTKRLEPFDDWWVVGFEFDCPNDTPVKYINGEWYALALAVTWHPWLEKNCNWTFWCNSTQDGYWVRVTWSAWFIHAHFIITDNLVVAYGTVLQNYLPEGIRRVALERCAGEWLVIATPNLDGTFCLVYQEKV